MSIRLSFNQPSLLSRISLSASVSSCSSFLSHEGVTCKDDWFGWHTFVFQKIRSMVYQKCFPGVKMSQENFYFYHQYNLILRWLVYWIFQKCLWAFVYLQWFFRCRPFQEVSTYQYISSEVRQDLFLHLYEPTYNTLIWYLHRSNTYAQGKNSPIVARNKAKSS